MPLKILFLAPYPFDRAPSQRFRFELFLKKGEVDFDFQSFLSEKGWDNLYLQGKVLEKVLSILGGFARRLKILLKLNEYSYIFIHRELTPFGPPVFEWIMTKIFRKKIIYDFDDAIWMNDGHDGNILWTWLKWRSKVSSICQWSWKVSAGNDYLAKFAQQYCDQVVVLPTVVDTEKFTDRRWEIGDRDKPKTQIPLPNTQYPTPGSKRSPDPPTIQSPNSLTIGWTGSHSTLFYLNEIIPVLQDIERSFNFEFVVIANRDPKLPLKNYRFIKWEKESEVRDLAQIEIGLMPLENTEWAMGKCGFKLIQYGALGIPSIASPVGANLQVVKDRETGFFAISPKEWKSALEILVKDSKLRKKMGKAAREHIVDNYSVKSQMARFMEFFEESEEK